MVMEAPPSPQSVGREFVRQYYTLLNKAPTHLHRFYNHHSSFVHGGLDPPNRETSPVIGQKQIHQKIQQLNFRDCHAKITQVDSQATLGNGVVVQVTGELSNAGHPMRRFTQTFVLAAQSPKKYYVHNDIFRYQDEIISDEECDGDGRSEGEEEVVPERPVLPDVQQPLNQPAMAPYYNPNAAQIPPTMAQVPPIHQNQQPPPHLMNTQPVANVNGAIHPDDMNIMPGQVPPHVPPAQNQTLGNQMAEMQGLVQASLNAPVNPVEEPQVPEEPVEELNMESAYVVEQQDMEAEREVPVESASNEPKTYANLLKSGNTVLPYGNPPAQNTASYHQQQVQPMRPVSPSMNTSPNQGGTGRQNYNAAGGNRGPAGGHRMSQGPQQQQQQQVQRMPRQDMPRNNMGGRNSMNEDNTFGDDRRRSQSQNFNDVNQLFLGNLPHMATEDELREIFGEYGTIVDLRVHSKPNNKLVPPGQRAPPNYGFITYETQQGVQNCLAAKPIFYPKDDKSGTLLNVEEKKNKDRSYGGGSGGGRIGMDNNRGGPRGDNGNQRRMGGGPGGPNRNGGGPPAAPGTNNRNNNYNNRNNSGPPNNRGPNTYRR